MTISKNDNFQLQELRVLVNGEMQNTNSDDYLSDRKIILVGVPGAFTPTCHLSHLPGYVENLQKFKAKDYSVTFVSVTRMLSILRRLHTILKSFIISCVSLKFIHLVPLSFQR